nr:retrotransposon protein, putative, unclassified [Tanacetum cinerariifolium]
MLVTQGEGSGTPTEPHHTPYPQAQQSSYYDLSSSLHPTATTESIPTETPTEIPTLRQYSRRATRIAHLKARIKLLEDKDKGSVELSGDDAPIKGRSMEIEEEVRVERSTERGSNDIDEMVNVLTSMDAANILTSGVQAVARDAKIARIHAEEELKMMIDGLDRNNEVIARHLQKYEESKAELSIGEKIDLINELVKYQDHHAKILKYQLSKSSHSQRRNKWNSIYFVHMASKEEGERVKRKGLKLEHGSAKKMKTSEEESEEYLKEMMQLVFVEEEVLGFSDMIVSGNPTHYYDLIVSTTSPTLTLFRNSDFLLEKVNAFLALETDPTLPKVDQSYLDSKGDILLLEAPLKEEVYVNQPDGFVDSYHPDKVYRLKKALYGLKQAPRAWYDELSNFMVFKGFSKGSIDPTLFITKHGEDILLVQIYVDDIIFGSTNPKLSKQFEKLMHIKFEMSMMVELKFFLGIKIHQSPCGIFINQAKYAQEILIKHDLDHAGCLDSHKSTSGGIQFLGGDKLVSWSSKKQDCTSMSSSEVEYVSLSACCTQVLWMRTQLTDYGFHFDQIPMYCDSKAAIAISCNPVQYSRTKHIDVRYHFIKEKVEKVIVELFFVGTEYQLADLFTKALPEDRFK